LNQQQTADKLSDLAFKKVAENRQVERYIAASEMARKQRIADNLSHV
jgi:hypothetical protein